MDRHHIEPDSAITIRPTTPNDAGFLVQMLRLAASSGTTAPGAEELVGHGRLGRYVTNWGRPGDTGVIAEVDGRPIGAAWYRHLTANAPGYGYVRDGVPELSIAVEAEWRARGVGRQLLAALIGLARQAGEPGLSLSVSRENAPAMTIYESLGFSRVGGDDEHPTLILNLPK